MRQQATQANCIIELQVSSDEKELLESLSRQCSLDCSDFLRTLVFDSCMLSCREALPTKQAISLGI